MSDKLEQLYPEPVELKVGGLDISVKPLTIGQLPKITKLLKGIRLSTEGMDTAAFWTDLIADHGDGIIEAIAIAAGQKRDAFNNLPIGDFIRIAVVVVKVNSDFFTQKVMPEMNQLMITTGLTQPSASSPTVTGTETSPDTP